MIRWNGDQLMAQIRRAVAPAVLAGAQTVLAYSVRLIVSGPKTGTIYRRRGVEHQASAPGEPPASDTGTLVQRGDVEFDAFALRASVVFRTDYALALELGTERMEPRPYLRPSLDFNLPAIQARINLAISGVLRNPGAGAMG